MVYHNNILCIRGGWLYTDGQIMSKDTYDKLLLRGQMKRIQTGGNGRTALIEYESIPQRFKSKIVEKIGDPYKIVKNHQFKDRIKQDPKAREYYSSYILSDGRRLPVKYQDEYYTNAIIINAINSLLADRKAIRRGLGGKSTGVWDKISRVVNELDRTEFKHSLPANARKLYDTVRAFNKEGYEYLISGKFCNRHSEKINESARIWMVARWANQVDRCANEMQLLTEYNQRATAEGWKPLKSVNTIHNYLYREDIKELWWSYRYGELKSKEKFALQLSTILPNMRDALWYSDGTKLNYFYIDENNKVQTCQVYEVMDAYSEMLLGYHISASEDYQAQYFAYKMALKTAGHKPYQITYDNQGGHKKLLAGDFFKKIAHLGINTQPYNGKSKTIENAFKVFQTQFLKRDWFFTGQNITAKSNESKANMAFILDNKASLPTLSEIKSRYAQRREEWNNAPHHATGLSRREMYYRSHNPESVKVDMLDMVDLFWITREKPVTLNAYGLSFTEKGVKYDYLVYKEPMVPDQEWLRKNIDRQFIVRFDPEDMGTICLYTKDASGLRFVAYAETKITIHRDIQSQEEGEAIWINAQLNERDRLRIDSRNRMEAILKEHGMTAEQQGLVSSPIRGLESKRKATKKPEELGKVLKAESMAVMNEDDEEINIYNLY